MAGAGKATRVSDFVARHGLWTQQQEQAAAEIAQRIAKLGTVRFAFSDPHGVVRGKTLIAADAIDALRSGVTCTATMVLKDLSGLYGIPDLPARRQRRRRHGHGGGPHHIPRAAMVAAERLGAVRPL